MAMLRAINYFALNASGRSRRKAAMSIFIFAVNLRMLHVLNVIFAFAYLIDAILWIVLWRGIEAEAVDE